MPTIHYYFSLMSPYTYMGHARFLKLAEKHHIQTTYRPVNFGKIFPISGGVPVKQRAVQRQHYRMTELNRWKAYLNLPMNPEPKYFPVDDRLAAYWVIAATNQGLDVGAFVGAILGAVWAEEKDIADTDTLSAIAEALHFPLKELKAEAEAPETKDVFGKYTEEAIEKEVFGAPTWVYKDELFWGQDRLDFLERALQG